MSVFQNFRACSGESQIMRAGFGRQSIRQASPELEILSNLLIAVL
jgi:hypothetical protein